MKTLKQIKDDYAIQQGFANWYELLTYCKEKYLNHYITEVMKIYAMECLKRASINAKIHRKYFKNGFVYQECNYESFVNVGKNMQCSVSIESIISEKNIIK